MDGADECLDSNYMYTEGVVGFITSINDTFLIIILCFILADTTLLAQQHSSYLHCLQEHQLSKLRN